MTLDIQYIVSKFNKHKRRKYRQKIKLEEALINSKIRKSPGPDKINTERIKYSYNKI